MLYDKITLTVVLFLTVSGCFQIPLQHHIVGSALPPQRAFDSEKVCAGPMPFRDSVSPLNGDGFRILVWNLYKGFGGGWQADLQALSAGSDLILLQEAYLQKDFLGFLDNNNLQWQFAAAYSYQKVQTGVMTASESLPRSSCSFRSWEPLIRLPKTVLITYHPLSGHDQDLLVANIHGINYSLGLQAFREQINTLISMVGNHQGPLIIAGDFNAWSGKRRLVIDAMVGSLGLATVRFQEDHRVTVFGHTLDEVYYKGLEAQGPLSIQVTSSDHNPLLVTFKLVNREAKEKMTELRF
ncbi:MAG: endonuclease/exonuclease/phosphatase family protein [Deltaproteobacteria bacterium]|jgi:endonuclease/exonuclease/phosphatase (EEP) superfamily protein YafD|nr:endonuclease/exonuclease/phosphatase family protein [Deltaproteobacteria bacterium]MBW2504681.1 endonuclease/exonuclease/phosphatase family protein [Deltaproteobacteria bacterium]